MSGLSGPFRWVGSHGAEFDGPLSGELAERRDALADLLAPRGRRGPGCPAGGQAGQRGRARPAGPRPRAAAALLERPRTLVDSSLTLKPGKEVLEIAVTDADKGTALRRLVAELGAAAAMYLGDDVTDEDGFRALGPDGLTVKIGDGDTGAALPGRRPRRRARGPAPAGRPARLTLAVPRRAVSASAGDDRPSRIAVGVRGLSTTVRRFARPAISRVVPAPSGTVGRRACRQMAGAGAVTAAYTSRLAKL